MSTSNKPGTQAPHRPESPTKQDERVEGELDKALDETFPASDPAATVAPSADAPDGEEDALDEALEESFPASDPPAPAQPKEK